MTDASAALVGHTVLGEDGPPIVVTPGGRYPRACGRSLAEQLAGSGHRVAIFDRRNSGESPVHFGPRTESDVEADDIVALIEHLGWDGVTVLGGGGGARAALLAARRSARVRAIALWWLIGGPFGLMTQGARYTQSLVVAARRGGMRAVVDMPELADTMRSPANVSATLAMDVDEFVAAVTGWLDVWLPRPETVVPGISPEELAAIDVPALVFRQYDDFHPLATAEALAALLPQGQLVEPPTAMGPGTFWTRPTTAGPGEDSLADWAVLAPPIAEFVAAQTVRG